MRTGLGVVALLFVSGCALLVPGEPAEPESKAVPAAQAMSSGAQPQAPATGVDQARSAGSGAAPAPAKGPIPRFSSMKPGAAMPSGWENWLLGARKTPTSYRIVLDQGSPVLAARAHSSASGLITKLDVDPRQKPVIEWRWRVDQLIEGADNTVGSAEDSPVRVMLAFDGDKSRLPMRERMFFERVKLLSGREMPYAMLMYIWENRQPVDAVLQNPHTARIQKVVVASGPNGLKRWQRFRRNIVEDYRRAFGGDPGRLIAVAVMTDSDNTGTVASAWYGDIELRER